MMCHWQTLSVFFLKKTLDNNVVKRFGKGCSISANILEIWKYVYCRKGFQSYQCTLKKRRPGHDGQDTSRRLQPLADYTMLMPIYG